MRGGPDSAVGSAGSPSLNSVLVSATLVRDDDLLTPREAVELSGVPLNAVKKALSQRVVAGRRRGGRVFLSADVLGGLGLLSRTKVPLPVEKKRRVVMWAAQGLEDGAELKLDDVLAVKADPSVVALVADAHRYVRLRNELIESDPDIAGGEPVIKGSRVPVRGLARQIELGESFQVLRDDYPQLPAEAFEIAPIWARANPRTGRPPRA